MGGGGTPFQVWTGGGLVAGLERRVGTPPKVRMGATPTLARIGWGTPPVQDWMGYPRPIRQSSITSTCYVAGGMPLAFTQEDFVYKQECLSALCHASFVDVYLTYLKSYGHLKIVKCIGMY